MFYEIKLLGDVSPKARPRVSGKVAYLPHQYRLWKNQAIIAIQSQLQLQSPLQSVSVSIQFLGISKRGDLDNLAGAILDALVGAKVLLDDRIAIVPSLFVQYYESKNKETIISISPVKILMNG